MGGQSLNWGFQRHTRRSGDDLATLWQRARIAAENAPACPCHGIVAGRVDPDVIETNMLNALRTRYRADQQHELVALIEARLRKSPFAGMRQPFEQWLRALDTAALDTTMRDTMRDDIAAALTYYAEAEPQFTCTA